MTNDNKKPARIRENGSDQVRKKEKETRRRIRAERRSDEDYLYYVLERDLDRDAIFPGHDGWESQVPMGKKKRIDYVIKYGKRVYGVEVKKGFPKSDHFAQAERYLSALDGVFLAYPPERAAEAPSTSEKKATYSEIGLISLTLFRSFVTKKAELCERQNNRVWNMFDPDKYSKRVKSWKWEQTDSLPATLLKDGCFWVSFTKKGRPIETDLGPVPLRKSDWIGLGLLYGASKAISVFRYFSAKFLYEREKSLGWSETFDLSGLVQCDLADERSYGERLFMFNLSGHADFLEPQLRKSLKRNLGEKKWDQLKEKTRLWRQQHRQYQASKEKAFILM